MGQKTNSNSLNLLKNKTWNSFSYVDYCNYFVIFKEDFYIYLYLRSQLKLKYDLFKKRHIYQIEILKSFIYRTNKNFILNLHLIYLKRKRFTKKDIKFFLKVVIVKIKKLLNYKTKKLLISYKVQKSTAFFIALQIGACIENRVRFKSKTIEKLIQQFKSLGIKVISKGRLNFVDRARKEQNLFNSVPLQKIQANIDYGFIVANTKKGLQSIKVWAFYATKKNIDVSSKKNKI